MKVLRLMGSLTGYRPCFLLASITADQRGVFVESPLPRTKSDLIAAISDRLAHGSFARFAVSPKGSMEEPHTFVHSLIVQQPGDVEFLEAMLDSDWFWGWRKFGGYVVNSTESFIEATK
jgi:hypothetical protein